MIRGYPTGSKRVRTSRNRPERGQIQSISGPKDPKDPDPGLPGSIQHFVLGARDSLWLPGQKDRSCSNNTVNSVLWVPLARRESGPLSPGHRSRTTRHRVRYCQCGTGCGVVYPGCVPCNGMGVAGHWTYYYHGVPPPLLLLLLSVTVLSVTVLSVTVRYCPSLFGTVRYCPSLFGTVRHCSVLSVTVRQGSNALLPVNGVTHCFLSTK